MVWYCNGKTRGLGRLPADIPVVAERTYAGKGWKSMGDWLGTGVVATYLVRYRSFGQARSFACRLGLNGVEEWRAFCRGEIRRLGRLPKDIPVQPFHVYRNSGWKGWRDWLGTGRTRHVGRRNQ